MSEVTLYSVATGGVDPSNKQSRKAVKFIKSLHGFVGANPYIGYGVLWLFDTENNAKIARNKMIAKGIECGNNICDIKVDKRFI